jgi:hypothetical protein
MGTLGFAPFDDDDAADWAAGLIESGSIDSIAEALMELLFKESEYLEAPVCSRAVAAAEVVAALNGRGSSDLPEEIRSWAATRLGTVDAGMLSTANRAIAAVMTGSELQELWEESGNYAEWRARMTDLSRRLV